MVTRLSCIRQICIRTIQSRMGSSNSSKSENQFAVELIAGYDGQTNSR